ncbi:MAG: nucleotidyltransferase domain-containing protein [Halobacteriota archaeon]
MNIKRIREETRKIALNLSKRKREVLAVGLFGSLARGNYNERSDIDIFIITNHELTLKEQDELYYSFSALIPEFGRDITVLVYDRESLKAVPSWQTLNLIHDACFVYDPEDIKGVFKMILEKAEQSGIIYETRERVFKSTKPGRAIFSLK